MSNPSQEGGEIDKEDLQDQINSIRGSIGGIKDWVRGFVEDFVFGLFVPLYKGFYYIPIVIAAAVGVVFLGGDRALKSEVEGMPGLADLPVVVATLAIEATQPIGDSILTTIWTINRTLVFQITGSTGALAAPLLAIVQVVELGVLLFLLWSGAEMAASLPGAGIIASAGTVLTRPFRGIVERIR